MYLWIQGVQFLDLLSILQCLFVFLLVSQDLHPEAPWLHIVWLESDGFAPLFLGLLQFAHLLVAQAPVVVEYCYILGFLRWGQSDCLCIEREGMVEATLLELLIRLFLEFSRLF